jgi:DNA-binding transcriptional regulator YhcF (GntR family)
LSWIFSGEKPIYTQLVERLQLRIVTGEYPPGARLSSVRDLAAEAAVNPNTMQRALAELENMGLVYSQRTSGRFVTEDGAKIAALREQLGREKVRRFLAEMRELGYRRAEAAALLETEEEEA